MNEVYDIIITDSESEYSLKTKMTKIPNKGDKVGVWVLIEGKKTWQIMNINSIIYEFNPDGHFNRIELYVSSML